MWTTPSKKPRPAGAASEKNTTACVVMSHVVSSESPPPGPRILGFAPVCYRQVRNLGTQGLGDGKALLKRTERLVGPNQEERKEKLNKVDATERVCLR